MSLFDLATRRTRQPQHFCEAARDAAPSALWGFGHEADVVSRRPITRGSGSAVSYGPTGRHIAVSGTSVLGRCVLNCNPGADKPGAADFTVVVRFILTSTGGYSAVGRWNSGGSPSTCDWMIGADASFAGTGNADFQVCVGSTKYAASCTTAWTAGNEYVLIGRRRGTTLLVDRYNVTANSTNSGSTTNAGITTINSNSARSLKLGEIDVGATYNAAIAASYVALFARAISDAEVRTYFLRTQELFEDEEDAIIIGSGTGGTDLVIADALHAHAADAPVLTTDWLLTVADALHAHAADSLTVSTDWLLAVADATHGHVADNLDLDASNATPLTVADALHAHAADSVTLTVDTWLAIADALHAHAAEQPTLGLGQVALIIADALHAHAADNVALTLPGSAEVLGRRLVGIIQTAQRGSVSAAARPRQTSTARRSRWH